MTLSLFLAMIAEILLYSIGLINAREIMNGIVHDIVWVKSVAEMGGDARHWDATTLWVLTEALVVAVREGKE